MPFLPRLALALFYALGLALSTPAQAAGTIPFALQQQVDQNGRPIQCFLYIYQVGTTATLQNVFTDFGLTIPGPNPLQCDAATGRLPLFWLADGQVHARLTDAGGSPLVDVPVMQVLGPSSGGGGGGGSVDPSSIASTGDIKFRATTEILTGWVKLNGLTIGSATSGATGRANSDTQNLFVYLWNNCPNAHCAVIGGRGSSGLSDFSANKQIAVLDWRARTPVGLDDMGTSAAGRMLASNISSGGGDGVTTPNATGGEANHVLTVAELAAHNHSITDPGHTHNITDPTHAHSVSATQTSAQAGNGASFTYLQGLASGISGNNVVNDQANATGITGTNTASTGITIQNIGSNNAHNTMMPFILGSWYMKL
jgi:hypothetical protein